MYCHSPLVLDVFLNFSMDLTEDKLWKLFQIFVGTKVQSSLCETSSTSCPVFARMEAVTSCVQTKNRIIIKRTISLCWKQPPKRKRRFPPSPHLMVYLNVKKKWFWKDYFKKPIFFSRHQFLAFLLLMQSSAEFQGVFGTLSTKSRYLSTLNKPTLTAMGGHLSI